MNCPFGDEILTLGVPPLVPGRQQVLRAHVEECSECHGALERLRAAKQVLEAHRPEPGPGVRTRIRASLAGEGEPRAVRIPWRLAVVALGAAAAAVLLILVFPLFSSSFVPRVTSGQVYIVASVSTLGSGDAIPEATRLEVVGTVAELDLGKVRVRAEAGTLLRVASVSGAHAEVLRLDRGAIGARVDPLGEEEFRVVTPGAEVRVVGTDFRVEVDETGTSVAVREGVVEVRPTGPSGAAMHILKAGDSLDVPHAPAGFASEEEPATATAETAAEVGATEALSPSPPAAPASPEPGAKGSETRRRTLAAARDALPSDPDKAALLASRVLETGPADATEIEALLLLADAHRRRGRLPGAMAAYRRVVRHPAGRAYAEEALLQLALLSERTGDSKGALEALKVAARRFPDGGILEPERVSLEARLLLGRGAAVEAANALERLGRHAATLEAHRTRVEVAKALLPDDPDRAAALLRVVLKAKVPTPLASSARALLGEAERLGGAVE